MELETILKHLPPKDLMMIARKSFSEINVSFETSVGLKNNIIHLCQKRPLKNKFIYCTNQHLKEHYYLESDLDHFFLYKDQHLSLKTYSSGRFLPKELKITSSIEYLFSNGSFLVHDFSIPVNIELHENLFKEFLTFNDNFYSHVSKTNLLKIEDFAHDYHQRKQNTYQFIDCEVGKERFYVDFHVNHHTNFTFRASFVKDKIEIIGMSEIRMVYTHLLNKEEVREYLLTKSPFRLINVVH